MSDAAAPPAAIAPAAEPSEFDLDFDDVDDAALPQLPVMAEVNLPDSVAALSLDFDDDAGTAAAEPAPQPLPAQWRFRPPAPPAAPVSLSKPEPVSLAEPGVQTEPGTLAEPKPLARPATLAEPDPLPEPEPLREPESLHDPEPLPAPAVLAEPAPAPLPEPTAQDLISGDTLSEDELQAAIEVELAALDARMAAAQPAPAVQEPARGDERREPTLDFSPRPDELDEEDEQALLQLSNGGLAAQAQDDIPPSHTLLRTVSAPPADRYYEPEFHSTETLVAEPVVDHHTLEPEAKTSAEAMAEPADDEPGFVKRERHRERYGRATTIALCLGIVLMLGALAAQGLTTFRNPLAAAMPSLKPALVAACQPLGCKVELPSQIDELAIEQGELQTLSDNTFSFSTSLKNSSGSAQAWPHIELVLDDANDKTVLRRVLAPRDYLDPEVEIAQGFPARSEQPVKLYFELKQPRASGYHIAVFYP